MNKYRWLTTTAALTLLFMTLTAFNGLDADIVYKDRHLVQYDSGVVYDTERGLEWLAGPDQSTSWEEAKAWVSGLDQFGGGWRMPTRKELKTLYHIGDGVNNITYLLVNSGFWIWSGQTKDSSTRWIFSFSYGGEGWNGPPPADGGRALAVRTRKFY